MGLILFMVETYSVLSFKVKNSQVPKWQQYSELVNVLRCSLVNPVITKEFLATGTLGQSINNLPETSDLKCSSVESVCHLIPPESSV